MPFLSYYRLQSLNVALTSGDKTKAKDAFISQVGILGLQDLYMFYNMFRNHCKINKI